MRIPPESVTVGETLSKDEIEDAFDTGFGYQISGINPRRDDNDQRYILVFANEDGPYDDSVTTGRFEYIGEGLDGDQSAQSPGNSALIDATTTEIPVHFFYQGSDESGWEYQGLVEVGDYEFREQGGRQVLVFTMEHLQQSGPTTDQTGLYLVPVSDDWRERFRTSVETPHDLTRYDDVPPQLEEYRQVRIWGTTETEAANKQAAIDQLQAGDAILFYHDGDFIAGGRVEQTFEEPEIGVLLWDQPKSRYIYTLDSFTTSVPSIEQVWCWLGYEGRQVVQGFSRVADDRLTSLRAEHGSVKAALFDFNHNQDPTVDDVEQEKSALQDAVDSPPDLTEDVEQYTESRRRARDSAFAELVKAAYDNRCAICGSNRESPNGNPEVEGAHIYPRSENGSDDVRNGIVLCRLHHWAFDSGWLSLTDNLELLVKEDPERNGYHEFKQLEGRQIRLPDDEALEPHPKFLREHRLLHGFSERLGNPK